MKFSTVLFFILHIHIVRPDKSFPGRKGDKFRIAAAIGSISSRKGNMRPTSRHKWPNCRRNKTIRF